MRFLHTADLHLGRVFHERSLYEDQEYILNQILNIAKEGNYDALLIPGDVYDRSLPSAEAHSLLGNFLSRLSEACPALSVCICSGNHDSAERLAWAGPLFSRLGIHINGSVEQAFTPVLIEGAADKQEASEGHEAAERCAVFLLPFLYPGSLSDSEGRILRSQAELMQEAARRLALAADEARAAGAAYCVLLAHLFTTGGLQSESERIFLGTAEQVDASLFSSFDYVALGHLHRHQKPAPNCAYSGSPLVLHFEEAEHTKVILDIELQPHAEKAELSITPIELRPLRKAVRLSGRFEDFLQAPTQSGHIESSTKTTANTENPPTLAVNPEAYLELRLTNKEIVENPLAILRQRFPLLLSIHQEELEEKLNSGLPASRFRPNERDSKRPLSQDFNDFITELYGQSDAEKAADFQTLEEEAEDATHQTST